METIPNDGYLAKKIDNFWIDLLNPRVAYSRKKSTGTFTIHLSDQIEVKDYKLSVYDQKIKLDEKIFTTNTFDYTFKYYPSTYIYQVELTVRFEFNGIEHEEVIAQLVVDDYHDEIAEDVVELTIGVPLRGYSHSIDDIDVFQFEVEELGYYQLTYPKGLLGARYTVYDSEGREIGRNSTLQLSPGRYYIAFRIYTYYEYTISLEKVVQ